MRQILINEHNLGVEDLDFEVIRAKGLVINDRQELLIAHNNGTYQLPGGHVEGNETLEETLIREIREETGIDANICEGPFMQITTYDNNYFKTGKRVCNKIYYYVVLSNQVPDLSKTKYDELECQTEFNLFYMKLKGIDEFFTKSIEDGSCDPKIGEEMLLVIEEYNRLYGGIK